MQSPSFELTVDPVEFANAYDVADLADLHEKVSAALETWLEDNDIPQAIRDLINAQGLLYAGLTAKQDGRWLADLDALALSEAHYSAILALAALRP